MSPLDDAIAGSALFRTPAIQSRKQRLDCEVLITQPFSLKLIVLILVVIVASTAFGLLTASYSRTAEARGVLITDEAAAQIIANQPGYVTQLFVKEGQSVQKGQRLAELRVEPGGDDSTSPILKGLNALALQESLSSSEEGLSADRLKESEADYSAVLGGLNAQRANLIAQINDQDELLLLIKASYERVLKVGDRGFVSQIEVQRRYQELVAARQDRRRLEQQLTSVEVQKRQAKLALARASIQSQTEINGARNNFAALAREKAELMSRRAYILLAPIAGVVTALQTAVGKPIVGAAPLMVIAPKYDALHAEVYAPPSAVGFIKIGQEVRLRHDAFPYQRYGSFAGTVSGISKVALASAQVAAQVPTDGPVYKVDVKLPALRPGDPRAELQFRSGMTLTATFVLERRTLLSKLKEPFNAVKSEALE